MPGFSRKTYNKALSERRPILVHGELGELTMWQVRSASSEAVYNVVTDGADLLTCTCRHGETRGEGEPASCWHAAAALIELIRKVDES